MCMQGRMQKWCETGMIVSFNGENRSSFSSVNTFQILETVYHLILLVSPLVASSIESN